MISDFVANIKFLFLNSDVPFIELKKNFFKSLNYNGFKVFILCIRKYKFTSHKRKEKVLVKFLLMARNSICEEEKQTNNNNKKKNMSFKNYRHYHRVNNLLF